METGNKLMNVTRLVAATVSVLYLASFFMTRGDYLPSRMFVEIGFVWVGMVIGCKLNLGKTARTVTAALSLPLLLLGSLGMLFAGMNSLLSDICSFRTIGPLAFILFGIAHSGVLEEETGSKTALRSSLVLSLLFPLIVIFTYIAWGWTVRSFLEWEDMPIKTFFAVRESSGIVSMFLRLVFYVFLVRLFRTEPLQKLSVCRWFRWLAILLIVITGLSYFMRGWRFIHSFMGRRYFLSAISVPAVWYIVYYIYKWGKKPYGRLRQIREYVKRMDAENGKE